MKHRALMASGHGLNEFPSQKQFHGRVHQRSLVQDYSPVNNFIDGRTISWPGRGGEGVERCYKLTGLFSNQYQEKRGIKKSYGPRMGQNFEPLTSGNKSILLCASLALDWSGI